LLNDRYWLWWLLGGWQLGGVRLYPQGNRPMHHPQMPSYLAQAQPVGRHPHRL
jgi:hypothetical protein